MKQLQGTPCWYALGNPYDFCHINIVLKIQWYPFYTPRQRERGTLRVKGSAQEHNTMQWA